MRQIIFDANGYACFFDGIGDESPGWSEKLDENLSISRSNQGTIASESSEKDGAVIAEVIMPIVISQFLERLSRSWSLLSHRVRYV